MVDSCRECQYCRQGLEQYCEVGNVPTYNSRDKFLGDHTFGGYSESITVDESFALCVPENLDLVDEIWGNSGRSSPPAGSW